MSTSFLLPPAFWFRVALRAPYVERPQAASGSIELPAECVLPSLGDLEDESNAPFSQVAVGWQEAGLAFVVEMRDKPRSFSSTRPNVNDSVDLCIDTRDTRDIHRASRFCHRFGARITRESRKAELDVSLVQEPIPRALAEAPKADLSKVTTQARLTKSGWRLELFFPSATLHGFDPETNRRLGLMVRVTDPHRGSEFLGVLDPSFPMLDDPSLWATLELTGRE